MPLRDHFRPPLSARKSWEALYCGWPAIMVAKLNAILPAEFVAEPRIGVGSTDNDDSVPLIIDTAQTWSPGKSTLLLDSECPSPSEYEVQIFDTLLGRRLAATVLFVNPATKESAQARRSFIIKCAALLQDRVCVAIVDPVTTESANLYHEFLDLLRARDEVSLPTATYAVAFRPRQSGTRWRLDAWQYELAIGQSLPTLPLWLTDKICVPLELEASYEEACRALRIR